MFTTGETYRELGGDYFQRRDPERATKRLVAKLHELGHAVTLQPAAARSNSFPISASHRFQLAGDRNRGIAITPARRVAGALAIDDRPNGLDTVGGVSDCAAFASSRQRLPPNCPFRLRCLLRAVRG